MLTSSLSFLLECMEYKDGVCDPRDVKYPVFIVSTDPDLKNARPDIGHRSVVSRILAELYKMQLVAYLTPRIFREVTDLVE